MKRRSLPESIIRQTIVLAWLLCGFFYARGEFKAGIAVKVVTPEPLLPVVGGIGPGSPVKDKRGDLNVRALVFEEGTNRVAIVSADFLGFPRTLGDKVRALVKELPADHILIGATHTHSAPDTYRFPDGKGGRGGDPKYLESVCSKMADAIREAVADLQPAKLKIATGEAKGKIAFNYYAEQLYDPRCHVIQVVTPEGKPIATLVNYAIHPEVLGSKVGLCSPDLIGPLYDRIAEKGGGTGIFMNSAQGGMVTADNRVPGGSDERSWEQCVRIGTLLADEALRIVKDTPMQDSPKLFCAAREIELPVESAELQALFQQDAGGREVKSVKTVLNLVNIGNAQILTIPGEALPNIGFYLKRKMRGEHNLLFGLTNDAYGYILTKEDFNSFKRYSYITRTSLGERTGEILEQEALRMVRESPEPQKEK